MNIALISLAMLASADSWWQAYGDPELNRLVEKVASSNLDLRAAAQRIAESRAVSGERKSALGPQINFTGGTQRLRGGFTQGVARIPQPSGQRQTGAFVAPFETGIFQGGLDMKWELDFFKGVRSSVAASQADVAAEEERSADLVVTLSAEAVRNYVELRGIEDRLAITRENAAAQRERLQLTAERARAGLDSQLDVERQTILLANTEAGIPPLEADRDLRLHRLAVLTGDFNYRPGAASPLRAPELKAAGVPSELLKRRPDVRAAEARIAAAMARLKQARSDLYPKITLNGLMGRQSLSLTGFPYGGGNFFNLGPQLQLPIFNYGRIKSNIAATDARLDQERTAYESEILTAMEEANNAVAAYRRQLERESLLEGARKSAETSLGLSADLQKAGLSDFLTVLDAQRSLLDAQFQKSLANTQALVESVALYKALAGGWL